MKKIEAAGFVLEDPLDFEAVDRFVEQVMGAAQAQAKQSIEEGEGIIELADELAPEAASAGDNVTSVLGPMIRSALPSVKGLLSKNGGPDLSTLLGSKHVRKD